ncbi:MAG: type II toxin-antitoxin system RelE/ParE family toxin [Defluviicoccus sp.]|nr:type II toxin-antitoxin system RelE/ParE family toxin [Defluviicoccus sp.]MDG4592050.1 type II toxin-antitoxin system RelE/ParE family toxin [Defluviicoccus sp.]
MAEIVWTEEAERWLRDIYDYLAAENPAAAAKVITGIHERVQVLRHFPEIGHIYRAELEGYIKILLYGHYRIAYLLRASRRIDVLGVFQGALDIERYLR